jgi:AcrR family transcriptional regulator
MDKTPYHHGDLKNALIEAGIAILAEEGANGLSLRKVASRAGVSHTAPYAHFADKQALIAAISAEGYRRLYERMKTVQTQYPDDPLAQLVETAWLYLDFAIEDTALFKLTFSGAVEKEQEYPDLVTLTQQSFAIVRAIAEACQTAGILAPGSSEVAAIGIWSQVHGLASLMLEGQISHTLLEQMPMKALLIACLQPIVCVPILPA